MRMKRAQSDLLKKYREAKGWTQVEAAEVIGVPAHTVNFLENEGGAHPRTVRKLVDGLGIDDRTFYGLEAAK